MNYENIEVGDVNIEVGFKWGELGLNKYFSQAEGNATATLQVNVGIALDDSVGIPQYSPGKMKILMDDMDGRGIHFYHLVRHIAFLAGQVSQEYRFCHAAGIQVNGKGVMLLGNSENGKSTLAAMLEGDIIDDDIRLVSRSEMRRVGKVGGRTVEDKVQWIEDDYSRSTIDYIFLLNNHYNPDHVMQVKPRIISPERTFDDKLHPSLLEHYRRRMPIPFEAPTFELGTKREPIETKRTIERLIA